MKKREQEITQDYFAKQSIAAKFFWKVIDILDDIEYNIFINKNKQT